MRFGQKKPKRRPYLRWLMLLLLITGALYLTTPYRLTPTGAVGAALPVRFALLLSEEFPGGRALLVERADAGYALVMVRKWGPLWRPVTTATLWPPVNGAPVSSTLAASPLSGGEMAVAMAGLVTHPRVARVVVTEAVPGDHSVDVAGRSSYLLIWTTRSQLAMPVPQVQAFDATGQVIGGSDGP